MKIVQKRENLYLIDAKTPICHKNLCRIWLDNGTPIYSDSGHLSIWGKNIIGQYILDQIRIIKQTTQNQ